MTWDEWKSLIDFWGFGVLSLLLTVATFFVSLRVKSKLNESHERRSLHDNLPKEVKLLDLLESKIQSQLKHDLQNYTIDIPHEAQKLLLHFITLYPRTIKPLRKEIKNTLTLIKQEKPIKAIAYFELIQKIREILMKEDRALYEH